MNRALIICGSAGRGGVTEAMCQTAAEALRGEGCDAYVLFPTESDIGHCTGCGRCRDGPCVIDDGMTAVYRLFGESDLLILASPLHFSGPSSLIKTIMDRFQPYWYDRSLPHPLACAAMFCAGSERPNFAPSLSIMRAFSITTGMKWLGHLEFPDTDRRGDDGVEEAVAGFVRSISEARGSLSDSQIWPPCSQGSE